MTAAPRTIRPLQLDDISSLQTIDQEQHGQAWSHRTFCDEIEGTDRLHLVAESADDLVGHASAWIDGTSCRVTNVAVAGEQAGQGHGSALLLALLHTVLEQHRIANVQLEVRPSNRRAQRMYSRFGFMPVGVERNFYDRSDENGSCDAVVMAVPDVCAAPWRERLEQLERDLVDSANDAGAAA